MAAVLIAGGATGIGRATLQRLRARCDDVFVADRDIAGARAAVTQAAAGRGFAGHFDLSTPEGPVHAVEAAIHQLGRLDAIVVCAGLLVEATLADTTVEQWDKTMALNLRAPFLLAKTAEAALRRSECGRIVLVGSTAGWRGGIGTVAYAASKGGIVAMVRSLALGFADSSVRVNCVAPGWVDTPFNDPYWDRVGRGEAERQALESRIPVGRQGTADEVAAVISFLVSPESSYLTGQAVVVDGGLLAG